MLNFTTHRVETIGYRRSLLGIGHALDCLLMNKGMEIRALCVVASLCTPFALRIFPFWWAGESQPFTALGIPCLRRATRPLALREGEVCVTSPMMKTGPVRGRFPRCPSPLDSGFRGNDGRCAQVPKGKAFLGVASVREGCGKRRALVFPGFPRTRE